MKKQILFFAMFSLAMIFFFSKNVIGQTVVYRNYVEGTVGNVGCAAGIPLNCAGNVTSPHLNPTPGVTYNYSITTQAEAVGSVLWFVTDNPTIINGSGTAPLLTTVRDAGNGTGTYILNAEAAVYNLPNLTNKDIDISWKNFDGNAHEVLLVAYVTGASGCSDNVEVWRIQPIFKFTLDVLSMADNGTLGTKAVPASECVSPVESATYNGTNLTMNYGRNYIFYSVTASNFVHSWLPALSAVATSGTIGTIEWAYPSEAIENTNGVASGTWNATTVPVLASTAATDGIVGQTGECIVVRVEVINAGNEAPAGAAQNIVTLRVNGVMYDLVATNYTNPTLADMDEPTTGTACVNNITDEANYIILPRPDIIEATPTTAAGPFEPKN